MPNGSKRVTAGSAVVNNTVERIYREWDAALSRNDAAALTELYAPDAVLESPLVPHLMGLNRPIRGREEIRALLENVAAQKPGARQYYRTGYFTDGKKVMWEYPRETPSGDQMDFVEAIELNDSGLIQKHRVYWGWYGFGVLTRAEYHK